VATCVICGGNSYSCNECGGSGVFEITQCPIEWIEDWVWQMIELSELYEKGLPPVAGGVLDQSAYFVKFAKAVMDESAQYKLNM
jgi:NADPH-dependent 7-cyano-7-deazaguanine reductase QueF-like protein